MKTSTIAAAAALTTALFVGAAAAEPSDIQACTSDGFTAALHTDITGSISGNEDLKTIVEKAFTETAKSMTKDELISSGYPVFMNKIYDAVGGKEVSPDAQMTVKKPEFGPANSCSPQ